MTIVQLLQLAILLTLFSYVIPKDDVVQCFCGGSRVNWDCPKDSDTCLEKNGKCYKVIEKMRTGEVLIQYGCYNAKEAKDPFRCLNGGYNPNINIYCCNNGTWCNKNNPDVPKGLPTNIKNGDNDDYEDNITLIIVAVVMAVLVFVMVVVLLFLCRKNVIKFAFKWGFRMKEQNHSETETLPNTPDDSGSGAGQPLLIKRTIARQIEIHEVIGKGRFGEVYRGVYNSSDVAVKKIQPRDQASWQREKDIYETHMLHHANILGVIATDNKDNTIQTEFWIISDYHQRGSLYDFLSHSTVNKETLLKMLITISNGLSHLHIEIPAGSQAKPPIAHRDLKSKNILVKNNLECVIADFGHAVRYFSKTNEIIDNDDFFGTKRYMAPEVLDGTINRNTFESFSRADVYSLGLVFWEVARRSDINCQNRSYELPYFDMVPADPSTEVMRKVVCDDGKRPPFYSNWLMDPCLARLTNIMEECWYENGAARLTALRIKKKLIDLRSMDEVDPSSVQIC